ncbi:MAG TPA: hypothetical protein VK815_14930 [Candidatus Acidoferrales bacterium]|jgi:hypothetical protein|nr:hypothetical protein [Candidatus Acidoferrales bacterium]
MKTKFILTLALTACLLPALAEDLTTLDGQTYADVRDVTLKQNGLFFVTGSGAALKGVTVPYTNLADGVKTKYHYDPFEMGLMTARQTPIVYLSKKVAFSLDQLEAAKARAKAEKKMIGFIMEWDSMLVPAKPMDGAGSDSGLAHFYVAFKDSLVLVFVRHEDELGKVPDAVQQGFGGPEEGGFAPNMAVVTADCSQFICEIPFGGGKDSTWQMREKVFREKIAVIKKFIAAQGGSK